MGYDSNNQRWNRLPSLRLLLPPRTQVQTTLKKDYLVASTGGLLCVDVSEFRTAERIFVLNPITQTSTELPPLNYRRGPVLLQVIVDAETRSYQVIVAGSASANDDLSRKTEVYSSQTGEWTVTGDVPGPAHSLNLFQSGVLLHGTQFCIVIHDILTVIAYNVRRGEWFSSWRCPFPEAYYEDGTTSTNPQLVRCGDCVVLFWERERASGRRTSFCFATLEFDRHGDEIEHPRWSKVTEHSRTGSRGLDSYPEFVCSPCPADPATECKVNVMNTIDFRKETYSVEYSSEHPTQHLDKAILKEDQEILYTLNPATFCFEPNYLLLVSND